MWPNPLETVDLVTFTEETFHGKLHILCSELIECHEDKKVGWFFGPLGILIFPVFIYSTNLILWKSFFAQYVESRSMFSKLKCGLQATGAGIDYVIVQLYFGQSIEMFEPFTVNYPAWMDVFSVELPVLFQQNVFLCLLSLTRFCTCYKIPSLYFHLFIDSLIQTVLQDPGPLMAVYFPILNPTYNRSSPPYQLYWNHTSAWVISCKFAAHFQNTFS